MQVESVFCGGIKFIFSEVDSGLGDCPTVSRDWGSKQKCPSNLICSRALKLYSGEGFSRLKRQPSALEILNTFKSFHCE